MLNEFLRLAIVFRLVHVSVSAGRSSACMRGPVYVWGSIGRMKREERVRRRCIPLFFSSTILSVKVFAATRPIPLLRKTG